MLKDAKFKNGWCIWKHSQINEELTYSTWIL
jgi:hypothetical protein